MERESAFRIHLFGQPRFFFDGRPYRFSAPPKALPLLAYLLLHRSAPLSREKIAFTLWEDDSEEDAKANLRRHLHHVQRALPPAAPDTPWLLIDADSLQWNPDAAAWVDAIEFERLLADADHREQAVACYGGDLLDTLYDEWIFPHRDRLRNEYVAALGDVLIEARGERNAAKAAAHALAILAADPWREDTVRQLMAVRYESGDRAGALSVYEQFDRRLRDEMNVDPMPETTALRDAILRNEELPAVGSSAVRPDPEAAGGGPLLPFVGRADELERLRALWSRAAKGRGRLVLVSGEAGIGKSRLTHEFSLLAEAQGARVLTGNTAYPESTPYQAVTEALRRAAPLLASLHVPELWLGVVAQAVPELRSRRPDLPQPPSVNPDREQLRLFEAMARCMEGLAKPRPLVVVLEDLHWAGEGTIAALRYLAARLSALPILIIATYREEEAVRAHPLRRLRRDLQGDDAISVVSPRPLRLDAVADLVRGVPGVAGRGDDVAEVLLARSAGNPLFLGEAIRGLLETPDAALEGLPSASTAIAQRVARLPERARVLAEAASVVGPGFNVDLVRDVTGWSENDVLDALSDLIDRHFVRETGGRTGFAYAFAHHLVQTTVYHGVDEPTRVRRHRHIARALEEHAAESPGQLAADIARHYDAGKDPVSAAPRYLEAARHADRMYALDEALAHVRRCLSLAEDTDVRWQALCMRESILARRGLRAEQPADLAELERIAEASGDIGRRFEAAKRAVWFARATAEREGEREQLERLEAIAAESAEPKLRAQALVTRAAYAALAGDHADARRAGAAALALFRELGDVTGQVEASCRIVEMAFEGGSFDRAREILEEARASAAATGNLALIARAMTSATYAALTEQRYEACRELALEAREICRTIGDREGEADVIARQASAAARLSLLDESKRCREEAIAIYESIGKRLGVAGVLVNSGIQFVRLGYIDEAERSLRAAGERFEALKDLRGQAACAVNLSYVRLFLGDAADARVLASLALELARGIPHAGYEAAALANLGGAERDLGEIDASIAHMERGLAIRRTLNRQGDYTDDLAHLMLVYVMAGRDDDARALGDELRTSAQTPSAALFMPQFAHWIAAQAFRALGDGESARSALALAEATVREHAAAISDASDRDRFLALAVNREVLSAVHDDVWPDVRKVASAVR